MSETLKFNVNEVKDWLEKETSSVFTPVHTKARKFRDEMAKALDSLADSSRMLLENSGKEIEKKNMNTFNRARALNKLARLFIDRIKQIKVPDTIYYDSLESFAKETQKALMVTEVDIRNYFPRISPFFIFDRRKFQIVFERAKDSHRDIENFLAKEYVKTKTLEETFNLISEVQMINGQLSSMREQISKVENERSVVDREIAEAKQKITDLTCKGELNQLSSIDAEIESLTADVKSCFQHLQKPFIKLQSLATHGEGSGLTPEELNKLNQYVDNPFEALATEETGYPLLKQILQKLNRLMAEDKLKLKPEKIRKAQQSIGNILNSSSLVELHQKCVEARNQKIQLSMSAELAEARNSLSKLKEQVENLERQRANIELDKKLKEKAYSEMLEKIRNHKVQMEKNILSFLGKRVHIE